MKRVIDVPPGHIESLAIQWLLIVDQGPFAVHYLLQFLSVAVLFQATHLCFRQLMKFSEAQLIAVAGDCVVLAPLLEGTGFRFQRTHNGLRQLRIYRKLRDRYLIRPSVHTVRIVLGTTPIDHSGPRLSLNLFLFWKLMTVYCCCIHFIFGPKSI